jgi:hypothetical protein
MWHCLNAAERVNLGTVEMFASVFGPCGFSRWGSVS